MHLTSITTSTLVSYKVGTGRKSCAAELFEMNVIQMDTGLNMQHKGR